MSDYEFWKELGKIFNAVVSYQEKSIEFNKRFINPWISIGNVFDQQNHQRDEVRAYLQATELDPGNAQNWLELGNAHYRNQAFDDAVDAFRKAIDLDPKLAWAYSNLALTYADQGKHIEAKALYEKSIQLLQENRDKAIVWNRLGNLHRKLNEYELAIQAFQKADELDRDNAGFRDVLSETSEQQAKVDEFKASDSIATSIQLIVAQSQTLDAPEAAAAAQPEVEATVASAAIEMAAPMEAGIAAPLEAVADAVSAAQPVVETGAVDETVPAAEAAVEADMPAAVTETIAAEPAVQEPASVETVVELTEAVAPQEAPVEEAEPLAVVVPQEVAALAEAPVEAVAEEVAAVVAEETVVAPEEIVVPTAIETTEEAMQAVEAVATEPVAVEAAAVAEPIAAPAIEETAPVAEEKLPADVLAELAELSEDVQTEAALAVETAGEVVEPAAAAETIADPQPMTMAVAEEAQAETAEVEESPEEDHFLPQPAYEEFLKNEGHRLVPAAQAVEETVPQEEVETRQPNALIDESGDFQLEMDANNAHVWNELGNVYFNRGSVEDAIIAYSKAIELDRLFAWPYSNLALAYVQKGRFAEATLLYQRSIELFSNDKDKAISWNRLGNVYRRLDDYDNAISSYQRADELDPDNSTLNLQSRFSLLGSFQINQNANANI